MIFSQIFDMMNIGLVILDKDLRVYKWNRWMELHSGIAPDSVVGSSVFGFFPNLKNPTFERNCKSVLTFGNFCFFSQKLHKYLFPFKPEATFSSDFEYMQQSCTMGPLREENNVIKYLFITVQDVTEITDFENKLLDMSIKDGLTGVFNRRFFDGRLKEEFERHKRHARPLSLIFLDIDFFKEINDKYGHQCGDFILKSLSKKVADEIRKIDILARYGGEEFCCLLLETDLPVAFHVAERLRKIIAEHKFNFRNHSIRITISLGISELKEGIDSPDVLLKKSDDALYKAKRTGRNKAVVLK